MRMTRHPKGTLKEATFSDKPEHVYNPKNRLLNPDAKNDDVPASQTFTWSEVAESLNCTVPEAMEKYKSVAGKDDIMEMRNVQFEAPYKGKKVNIRVVMDKEARMEFIRYLAL